MQPVDTSTYRVNEIFYSLQGEGVFAGTPAVFVRFSGCNRRCDFCDTDHSPHTPMTATEIASAACAFPARRVILTGGEPAMQADALLVSILHEAGFTIHIETNGSLPLPDGIDWVTCSPKDRDLSLTRADELKVVYTGEDPSWATELIDAPHWLLQPCSCANTQATVAYILAHPRWRLSLQTHKLIQIP